MLGELFLVLEEEVADDGLVLVGAWLDHPLDGAFEQVHEHSHIIGMALAKICDDVLDINVPESLGRRDIAVESIDVAYQQECVGTHPILLTSFLDGIIPESKRDSYPAKDTHQLIIYVEEVRHLHGAGEKVPLVVMSFRCHFLHFGYGAKVVIIKSL